MESNCTDFSIPIRVYIEDTDAGGIVFYVNYLKFMERARTELMRHLGFQHYALAEEQYQFVVHSANVRYRSPARIDDELLSTAKIIKLANTYILFSQQVILANDGKVLCEGEIKVACVDSVTFKPRAMDQELKTVFKRAYDSEYLSPSK
ncbi:MAG: tol-pal system-associated acyl-CoA thioesterase [Pseudomonadales bacterium]|nr:tol-pal system-associated acyl-CoA thioesterase [Pseudomonadales bacterium]